MAKLIGHYYDCSFDTFIVNGLRETTVQYKKTKKTEKTPESWIVLLKSDLGVLRPLGNKRFVMYELHEDMPRFKDMVTDALEKYAKRH